MIPTAAQMVERTELRSKIEGKTTELWQLRLDSIFSAVETALESALKNPSVKNPGVFIGVGKPLLARPEIADVILHLETLGYAVSALEEGLEISWAKR